MPPSFSLLSIYTILLFLLSIANAIPVNDVAVEVTNAVLEPRAAPDNFWLTQMTHGSSPYAPAGYPIFRNVKDYGAVGDGVTDDTDAINAAASAGGRCEGDCGSSSVLGAVVYFPSGTYKISKPIFQHYYTQFIGNPNSRPILKATAGFKGIALIDSDFYIPGGNGAQWYINQSNFFRQIRNLILDITDMPGLIRDGDSVWTPTALHWQVAQATSLQNIHFIMSTAPGNNQTGIFMENGSGGFIGDLTFYGGQFGMRCGAQQFTARDLHFTSCITAIQMIWDWTWTWRNIHIYSCWVGIDVTGDGSANGQPIGSITVLDSSFASVPIAILTSGRTNINLDNVQIISCDIVVGKPGGPTILAGGDRVIASWMTGRLYDSYDSKGTTFTGVPKYIPSKPSGLLDSSGAFFVRSKPQYETLSSSSFLNVKSAGAQGNGQADDTAAINSALQSGKIVFFPAGIYKVTSTINVPVGARIVGESWSQIMGTGSYFADAENPKVVVKVGNAGDAGVIEIQDMIFTTSGATAGAIIMEWNVKQSSQGSAAMWDSHIRVGGAAGTGLQASDCPKLTGSMNMDCMAASMLLHLTKQSSAYLENVWAWVADHDVDIPEQTQIDIYVARGVLIESTAPTWLWGTASEHSTLYQYQLAGASNVFMGLIQTESPYYQPLPLAPLPWTIIDGTNSQFTEDPTFVECLTLETNITTCAVSWALRILDSSDIYAYGIGFYSWFQSYDQACVPLENCQSRLIQTAFSEKIYLYGIATKGSQEVVSPTGSNLVAAIQPDNQNGYTTSIAAWLPLAQPGSAALGKKRSAGSEWVYTQAAANAVDRISIWGAFGDSYSAGPGAGKYTKEYIYKSRLDGQLKDCMIYNQNYAYQLFNSPSPASRDVTRSGTFWMNSCTGARNAAPPLSQGDPVTMTEQLRYLRGDEDFITLSIGGNDINFADMADACVFGFRPKNNKKCQYYRTEAAKALLPYGEIRRLLRQTYISLINAYYNNGVSNNLLGRKPHFTIFVTNYIELFRVKPADGTTTNCGEINFKYKAVPGQVDQNPDSNPAKMVETERKYWADLLSYLNTAIINAIHDVNMMGAQYANRLVYVDVDSHYDGHRFCEGGVSEPAYFFTKSNFYLPSLISLLNPLKARDTSSPEDANYTLTAAIENYKRDTEVASEIDVPDWVDEEQLLRSVNSLFGSPNAVQDIIDDIADANPTFNKRTMYDDLVRYAVGLVRTAHPTPAGFKSAKIALCDALCARFPNTVNCPRTDATCA
ncbi:hypothetical protein TWF481_002364 [Arthrobotrys musiformis]|uniref:Rhamnogalacturonase A/B/Epimerase-like pectate lyase domain-containing protein n=1 Tax=Arthrobotrys musiformis TaxID=47236 RepID=A0AAV9VUZ6_9PEZI